MPYNEQVRVRTRKDPTTVGGFLDSCKDDTTIILYFATEDGTPRVPKELGDPPTVSEIRLNPYLRPLKIHKRNRYQISGTGETGWVIEVNERFNPDAYCGSEGTE